MQERSSTGKLGHLGRAHSDQLQPGKMHRRAEKEKGDTGLSKGVSEVYVDTATATRKYTVVCRIAAVERCRPGLAVLQEERKPKGFPVKRIPERMQALSFTHGRTANYGTFHRKTEKNQCHGRPSPEEPTRRCRPYYCKFTTNKLSTREERGTLTLPCL